MTEMQYQYIHFVKVAEKPKTSVWECRNNRGGYALGVVMWEPGWRQYCFYPLPRMVFSIGCMKDICSFLESLKVR